MAARNRKRWSKFTGLMETAIILSDLGSEEQRRLFAENEKPECRLLRSLAEEEEESRRRTFSHFPWKLRSSLKKPNLIDLDGHTLIDSESRESYLQWLPSEMEALRNPSSESFSLPSLVEYNTTDDESEKTKMENPINPNLLSDLYSGLTVNTRRKRRAAKQIKRVSGVKKPKAVSSPQAQRKTPEWLVQVIENMEGEVTEAKLIFEKCLFVTDVNPTQNRLSMPCQGLLQENFLTDAELRIIKQDIGQKKKTGVEAILIMKQKSKEWKVKLKRWEMKKDKENGSWNYSLVVGWNEFVKDNGLKEGDNISVWSFRSSGVLYFALEKTS